MFIISKEFHFEASHRLKGLPEDHPCSRLHGHSYRVTFTLKKTTIDDVGFVRDYRELDAVKEWIDGNLDHQDLNSVLEFNPTAERIAQFLYEKFMEQIPELSSITVKETEKTSATYEPYMIGHKAPIFTR